MNESMERLISILRESSRIVFFGGAGISTASGIPDFRSANGIFSKKLKRNVTPEQAVSHSFFVYNTEEFYDFYKKYLVYPEAKPNACHFALARLEQMGKLSAVVTQNIDGLHQMAGSKTVYELHGSVHRNYCMSCHAFYDAAYVLESEGIPRCGNCGGLVKPDVVLYEEGLSDSVVSGAVAAISRADTLIVGGTSLVVYPAAGLLQYFRGKHLVLINKSETQADRQAELVIHEDISRIMKEAVDALEANPEGSSGNSL